MIERVQVVPGILEAGEIVTMGGAPLRVVRIERIGSIEWATFRPLTSREIWWHATKPKLRKRGLPIALVAAGLVGLLVTLLGCTIEQAPVQSGGNMECRYSDSVVCAGKFSLSGSCADVIDLSGTWRLCRDSDGVQCTLTATRSK